MAVGLTWDKLSPLGPPQKCVGTLWLFTRDSATPSISLLLIQQPTLFGTHQSGEPWFFSPKPLLLAYGTMGIEMAIAPLWVERQMGWLSEGEAASVQQDRQKQPQNWIYTVIAAAHKCIVNQDSSLSSATFKPTSQQRYQNCQKCRTSCHIQLLMHEEAVHPTNHGDQLN